MDLEKIDALLRELQEGSVKYADLVIYKGKGPYFVKDVIRDDGEEKLLIVDPDTGREETVGTGEVEDYLAHYKKKFRIDMGKR